MATAIKYTTDEPVRGFHTSSGMAGSSASLLRLIPSPPETNACEVVLSPTEYVEFRRMLDAPARVIPELAELLRVRRRRAP
jgi:hypothetical protein